MTSPVLPDATLVAEYLLTQMAPAEVLDLCHRVAMADAGGDWRKAQTSAQLQTVAALALAADNAQEDTL